MPENHHACKHMDCERCRRKMFKKMPDNIYTKALKEGKPMPRLKEPLQLHFRSSICDL